MQVYSHEHVAWMKNTLFATRTFQIHPDLETSSRTALSKGAIMTIYHEIVSKASTLATRPRHEAIHLCLEIKNHIQTLIQEIDLMQLMVEAKAAKVEHYVKQATDCHSHVSELFRQRKNDLIGLESDVKNLEERRSAHESAMAQMDERAEQLDQLIQEDTKKRKDVVVDSLPVIGFIKGFCEGLSETDPRKVDEKIKEGFLRLIPFYAAGKVIISKIRGDLDDLIKARTSIENDLGDVRRQLYSTKTRLDMQRNYLQDLQGEVVRLDNHRSQLEAERKSLGQIFTGLLNYKTALNDMITNYTFLHSGVDDLVSIDFSASFVQEFVQQIQQIQGPFLRLH